MWNEDRTCRIAGVCDENVECKYPAAAYKSPSLIEAIREQKPELLDELTLVGAQP